MNNTVYMHQNQNIYHLIKSLFMFSVCFCDKKSYVPTSTPAILSYGIRLGAVEYY